MKIEMTRDLIPCTMSSEPDPDWYMKCDCGVTHKWESNDPNFLSSPGLCIYELPTLKYFLDSPETAHHECRKCGEEIIPGTRTPMFEYCIPGKKRIFIDGKEVTEEDFLKIKKEWEDEL